MEQEIENGLLELIATERIYIPISSMDGKLKKQRSKMAESLAIDKGYSGDRAYARIEQEDTMKARGMSEAVKLFESQYPRHGKILKGMIEEKRAEREVTMYFGMNPDCRLTESDYLGVMTNLGFSPATAQRLYPELMDISRKLSKKRQQNERSILIG